MGEGEPADRARAKASAITCWKVFMMGAGSARPVVSNITWLGFGLGFGLGLGLGFGFGFG